MGSWLWVGALGCVCACGGRVAGTTETEPTPAAAIDGGSGTSSAGSGSPGTGGGARAGTRGADDGGARTGPSERIDAGSGLYVRTDAGSALFQASYPLDPRATVAFQCLPSGLHLPVGANGLPNCTVMVARTPASQTAGAIAECQRCDSPGLEPFVPSIPLRELGDDQSNQNCLCTMSPLANPAQCPALEASTASWCYTDMPSGPPGEVCAPEGGGVLSFSPDGITGVVYVACFPLPSP